ncbi:MAG: CCA tRNA nucleotidyltransferase [Gemmataceae bacterium]|nr:CCA tRNA nucleotidyltransferase [Gemmataceae bacterium]MCI0741328.1 CCA tRNA nucleotidyltransferase [Gemmataceae bacterium]
MSERDFAISVVRRLQEAGFQALWAGGCVRDELLGLVPKDYDVATDAHPEDVQRLFRRTVAVGASFGVIEVLGPKVGDQFLKVQVATFRSDTTYSDGRRPDAVVFSSPKEDALRRDFTINGMFFDPLKGELHDFVGGQADLHARVLRAIGDPRQRFQEDKLRLLRAVRIATRFELTLEPATEAAIKDMAPTLPVVSAERIAEELRQLLVHPRRARGLNLLHDLGLVKAILPELLPMRGLPQGPPAAPTGNLWDHVLAVMDLIGPDPPFALAMATLLHDVGKPRVVGRTAAAYTFYHHEHVGARIAGEIADRLKLSNVERERIVWLVEKHQYLSDARAMKPSKLKTTLSHPGIRELLTLHRADALASSRSIDHVDYCESLLKEWTTADLNPPPLVTGHDLAALGLEPGPLYKTILDAVREAQLDGTIGAHEEALDIVKDLIKKST